jgi:antitoxin component YwqK of YwqJK toxin-antitoxin module
MRNYFRSGQLRLLLVMNDTNRVLMRGYYENGALEAYGDTATSIEYFDNGKKRSETMSKTGQIYKVVRWFRNGKKQEESEWWNDKRNGRWRQWDSAGNRIRNELYRNGTKID